MTATKLDPQTPNNDVGLYWKKSRRVDPLGAGLPFTIGEVCTGMKTSTAGIVVVENSVTGLQNVLSFEAGEWQPIVYDRVLVSATIDGVLETTTATGLFWTTSPFDIWS